MTEIEDLERRIDELERKLMIIGMDLLKLLIGTQSYLLREMTIKYNSQMVLEYLGKMSLR